MLKKLRSPFIYYCDVKNHNEIKKSIYHKILKFFEQEDCSPKSWNCKVQTTFDYRIDILHNEHFLDSVVWSTMDDMLKEVDIEGYPKSSSIKMIWANLYEKGSFQEVHDHLSWKTDCAFSGIYILHQPGENKISFVNKSNGFPLLNETIHTRDLDVKEGSVMIFPANLLHYVNPVEDERCTISFNISCNF